MRFVLAAAFFAGTLACGRSSAPRSSAGPVTDASTSPPVDAALDASIDATDGPACFTNPQTYLEIINACTDAEAIDKMDDLSPMNLADGGLQPLP